MAFTVADLRAIIVLALFTILAFVARAYNHPTIMSVLVVISIILVCMFFYKLYRREIKKDYFSQFDKIEVPDEPEYFGDDIGDSDENYIDPADYDEDTDIVKENKTE